MAKQKVGSAVLHSASRPSEALGWAPREELTVCLGTGMGVLRWGDWGERKWGVAEEGVGGCASSLPVYLEVLDGQRPQQKVSCQSSKQNASKTPFRKAFLNLARFLLEDPSRQDGVNQTLGLSEGS